jgi:endonuclease YncB( thermonuclease family)
VLQVVNNLISNAIKFTPSGGSITLVAKPTEEGGKKMAVVQVEDTGPGISKEDQAKIFQRFVQLKNQPKQMEVRGTGLGLSICRALVELHKGRVWIESPVPGEKTGAMFAFTLPAVQRTEAVVKAAPAAASVAPKVTGKKGFWGRFFGRKKILLIGALLASTVAHARPHSGTVRRVLEPCLIQMTDGTKVRYLGIESPPKGDTHYEESLEGNRFKVEGKDTHLEYGIQERAPDGAWLAYVYVDGVLINEEMVRDGLALVTPLPNNEDVLPELLAAERDARIEKRGVWRDETIEPYDVRAQKKSGLPPEKL